MIHVPWSAVTAALVLVATSLPADASEATGPLLRLDEAVSIASEQNHGLAASELEVEQLEERSAAVVTRRFPAFKFDAIANRLLKPMDFPFNAGVFGTYPGIGPIPATDTSVSVPTGFSGTVTATIAQPITPAVPNRPGRSRRSGWTRRWRRRTCGRTGSASSPR